MGLSRVNRVRIFCDGAGCVEDIESPTVAMAVFLGWRKRDESAKPEDSPWMCPKCDAKQKGKDT